MPHVTAVVAVAGTALGAAAAIAGFQIVSATPDAPRLTSSPEVAAPAQASPVVEHRVRYRACAHGSHLRHGVCVHVVHKVVVVPAPAAPVQAPAPAPAAAAAAPAAAPVAHIHHTARPTHHGSPTPAAPSTGTHDGGGSGDAHEPSQPPETETPEPTEPPEPAEGP